MIDNENITEIEYKGYAYLIGLDETPDDLFLFIKRNDETVARIALSYFEERALRKANGLVLDIIVEAVHAALEKAKFDSRDLE